MIDSGAFTPSGSPGQEPEEPNEQGISDPGDRKPGCGESVSTTAIVSTDINPRGYQEYTEAGIHYLNSGANAKGILLGSQVSATSLSRLGTSC